MSFNIKKNYLPREEILKEIRDMSKGFLRELSEKYAGRVPPPKYKDFERPLNELQRKVDIYLKEKGIEGLTYDDKGELWIQAHMLIGKMCDSVVVNLMRGSDSS